MGNRCYLNSEATQIFESNNSFPVFWLMGLSNAQLPLIHQQLESIFQKQQTDGEFQAVTRMSFNEYQKNLDHHTVYVSKLYPELLPLYEDFKLIIKKEAQKHEMIEISYIEYLNFFTSASEVYNEIQVLFDSISSCEKTTWIDKNDPLGTTIGGDRWSHHSSESLSAKYESLVDSLDTPVVTSEAAKGIKEPTAFSLYRKLVSDIFVLVICLILAAASALMLIFTGNKVLSFLAVLFFGGGGLFFYFIEFKEQQTAIKSHRQLQKNRK
ncbi:hypothetical protein [Enterococcus sp. LJL51]|uniref:hypothetical protein n=1 Tax=Enterococcus sp. LJL51 TaxID=3416656 RepID=UPI003CF47EE0